MHRNVRQVTRVIKNLGVLVFLHQEDTIYLNSSGQTIANRHLRPGRELANGLLDFSSNSWEATVANSTYDALQTSLERRWVTSVCWRPIPGPSRLITHRASSTRSTRSIQESSRALSIFDISIQITVDTYGHLIPGTDIAWVDRLDSKTTPHQSAPGTHQAQKDSEEKSVEVPEKNWLPPRDSNPDNLLQRQVS